MCDLRDIRDRISDQMHADGLELVLRLELVDRYDNEMRTTVDRRRYTSFVSRGFEFGHLAPAHTQERLV